MEKLFSRFIVFTLFFLWSTLTAQTHIAVMEFAGKGVSETEANVLTDRLRIELFKTGKFEVVERALIDEILKEQGFQQSGCTSNECMVEVGKIVGADEIIGGSISKIGKTYSISARVVAIETGKILKIATFDHEGKISDLLKIGMKQVALDLTVETVSVTQPVIKEKAGTKTGIRSWLGNERSVRYHIGAGYLIGITSYNDYRPLGIQAFYHWQHSLPACSGDAPSIMGSIAGNMAAREKC